MGKTYRISSIPKTPKRCESQRFTYLIFKNLFFKKTKSAKQGLLFANEEDSRKYHQSCCYLHYSKFVFAER